jgi:serine/threonine protein kinase
VLISDDGHIQLAGFGRIMVAEDQEVAEATWLTKSTQASVGAGMATVHWLAPELLEGSARPTASSDVFAYGSLLYIVSGVPRIHLTSY